MKALRQTDALLPAERISAQWACLHADSEFAFRASEAHYLSTLAMALDDDLVALLLLKKLRMAAGREPSDLRGVVTMGSLVRFTFGGDAGLGRLAHPSCLERGSLSIASRAAAGLVGMRTGQTILWPDARDELRPLRVDSVERASPQRSTRLREQVR